MSRAGVGDTVEVDVRAIGSGGEGVGDLPDGRVVFVHRTAPGDTARVRLTESKERWARGTLESVVEPGEGRREPPCAHYTRCGGCTIEHLRYREQLRWKGRMVADALERIGKVGEVEPPDVVPSPREFRYRNRVTFHLRRDGGGAVSAGFHALGDPGRIVDLDGRCLLPEEPIASAWESLREHWGPGADRLPAGEALRLTLRTVADGVLLLAEPERKVGGGPRGSGRPAPGDPEGLVRDVPGLTSLWWGAPDRRPRLLAGDPEPEERWGERTVRLGPRAFLQVNREAAELLEAAVLRELGAPRGRSFVDAYCGIGAYGRRLAHHGGRVVGIELDPSAARAARDGAPDGFRVVQGAVEERLEDHLPADCLLVNPPRAGLDPAVPELLGSRPVPRLVYVSCDPATLARDLRRLGGVYRIDRIQAFDLFPQTAHVETLVTLERDPT